MAEVVRTAEVVDATARFNPRRDRADRIPIRLRERGINISELGKAFKVAAGREDDCHSSRIGVGQNVGRGRLEQADVLRRYDARRRRVVGQSRQIEPRVEDSRGGVCRQPACEEVLRLLSIAVDGRIAGPTSSIVSRITAVRAAVSSSSRSINVPGCMVAEIQGMAW